MADLFFKAGLVNDSLNIRFDFSRNLVQRQISHARIDVGLNKVNIGHKISGLIMNFNLPKNSRKGGGELTPVLSFSLHRIPNNPHVTLHSIRSRALSRPHTTYVVGFGIFLIDDDRPEL